MAKARDAANLLSQVPLFAGLSKAEIRRIAESAKTVEFPAGESVTEEGTPGGRFYVIESGSARVLRGGRTRATLQAGDYFGELSLIDGEPRSATVVAATSLRTYSIAEFNFRALLKREPGLAYKLLVPLARRLREAERTLLD